MSKKVEQFIETAKDVLNGVGGEKNISSVTHCMTRLRFNLKDESIPKDDEVQDIKGVIGVNRAGGQYQVIIGQQVPQVYEQLVKLGNFTQTAPIDENLDDQPKEKLTFKSVGNIILNKLAGSLTPIIPMLIAASMFKMLAAVCGPSMLNLIGEKSDLFQVFTFVGDAGFYFFPVVLGYTASKQFKTSPMVSMFLGAIMIDPNLVNIVAAGKPFTIFGLPMHLVNYSSTVVPIILSVWVMHYVESFFKKYIPEALSTIFVPTLTIIVMLPISLGILGPIGAFLGTYISQAIFSFGKLGGIATIIATAVIGAFWEILVITGMHLIMITVNMQVFAETGQTSFVTLSAVAASLSVAGMCLGVALRMKNKDQKVLTWGYLIASIIGGVTEPALYGLALKYKRPFLGMMIGGFLGGLYAASTQITAYVLVPVANFLALTAYVGGNSLNIINGIISGIVAFVGAAIATYLIGVGPEDGKKSKSLKLVEA